MLTKNYYRPVDAAALARTLPADLAKVLKDPHTKCLDLAALATYKKGDTGRYSGIGGLARCRPGYRRGAKTFGKGVIQDLSPLKDGGALKYTMAEYLTPSGQRVNQLGITPDLLVAAPSAHGSADPGFDAAVRILKESARGTSPHR